MRDRQGMHGTTAGRIDRRAVGRRIRTLRERRGWTRRDLGKHLGCPAYRLARYERGEYLPRSEVLLRTAQALRVTVDYLLTGVPVGQVQDPRLLERLSRFPALAPERQDEILRLLDAYLSAAPAGPAAPRPGGRRP
jgi:transcriptional regulator with XRE-family HTH domain